MNETPTPRPTLRLLAFWLGGVVLLGLLLFAYRHRPSSKGASPAPSSATDVVFLDIQMPRLDGFGWC